MAENIFDRTIKYGADRLTIVAQEWSRVLKAYTASKIPGYLQPQSPDLSMSMESFNEAEKRRIALTISWIYADIKLIANEFSSVPIRIKRMENDREEIIKDHPFTKILAYPNTEIDRISLLQLTVYWLSLRGKAYWYLAPEQGNPNKIAEIWPMQADRVYPIAGKTRLIDRYVYRLRDGRNISIDPDYVVFFRYADPYDERDGLSPLHAATLPMETEIGSSKWQRDTYVTGRGIPHSVISLDKSLGDREFAVASARIREDFEEERKVAITRAGALTVETVGISPKDLELIKSRQFTRDELDIIFLLVAIHDHSSDTWLQAADKIIKEKVIWSLHQMIAEQLTVQTVKRFYGEDDYAEFDDIRPQDRSQAVQEHNVNWRAKTINEAREDLGLPEYDDSFKFPNDVQLEGFGNLPVPLAIDSSFVTLLYDIGMVDPHLLNLPGEADGLTRLMDKVNQTAAQRTQTKPANAKLPGLPSAESPKRMTNRLAKKSFDAAKSLELKRWKKVALRELSKSGLPSEREFASEILSTDEINAVKTALSECQNEDEIRALFNSLMDDDSVV